MPGPSLLITGAAGNIGSKLTAYFRSNGHRLVLLDSVGGPGIESADLSRGGGWTSHFEGIDCVIHLAADARVRADWSAVARNNIDATLNVFEAAAKARVKRVIFASSVWVMEGYSRSPLPITENMTPRPVNAYGASKLAGERIAEFHSASKGLSVICFRIGACLPDPHNHPGGHLGETAWAQQKWLSNRDLCQAFQLAVKAPATLGFEIFNLLSANEGMRWDMSKAEQLLGFRAQDRSVPVPRRRRKRLVRRLKTILGLSRPRDTGPPLTF